MKKRIGILLLTGCLLAGCGSSEYGSERVVSEAAGDAVTAISVSHIVSGQMTEWSVSGEDIGIFRTWVEGLRYRHERFEDGNSPGDTDGGEVYSFVFEGETDAEISYVINGPDECYLLMDGEWYRVKNPSDPPVGMEENTGDFGSESTTLSEGGVEADMEPGQNADDGSAVYPANDGQTGGEQNAAEGSGAQPENGGRTDAEQGGDDGSAVYPANDGQTGGEQNAAEGSGAQPENGGQTGAEQNDEWGLTLRAELVSAEGCTVVFVKHGGAPTGELTSGSWYRLEKKEGDEWVEVPYAKGIADELAWTMEAWIIPDEGSMEFEVNWSYLYGELPSGTYRIVKEITDFRGTGDYDRKWYNAEFSL